MNDETKEKRQYVNENQQNIMKVFEYLAQDILEPKTVMEVGDALNLSKDQAFRTLWNLIDREWVEWSARGYRISPKITIYGERLRLAVADTLKKYVPEVK
jgi:DNA-binding IclR family transcriptional regulator